MESPHRLPGMQKVCSFHDIIMCSATSTEYTVQLIMPPPPPHKKKKKKKKKKTQKNPHIYQLNNNRFATCQYVITITLAGVGFTLYIWLKKWACMIFKLVFYYVVWWPRMKWVSEKRQIMIPYQFFGIMNMPSFISHRSYNPFYIQFMSS